MSAIIAAEAMHRLPRMQSYGPYPQNTRFGDFHVSADEQSRRAGRARRLPLCRLDALHAAGPGRADAASPATARRPSCATRARGSTSSTRCARSLAPRGLSRRRTGPRSVRAAQPRQDRDARDQPRLADDRRRCPTSAPPSPCSRSRRAIRAPNRPPAAASRSRPGVYVLSAAGPVDAATLPATAGHARLRRVSRAAARLAAAVGAAADRARRTSPGATPSCAPASSTRRRPTRPRSSFGRSPAASTAASAMRAAGGYEYAATVPAGSTAGGAARVRHHGLPRRRRPRLSRTGSHQQAVGLGLRRPVVVAARRRGPADAAAALQPRHRCRAPDLHPHRRCGAPRALPRRLSGVTGQPVFHFELPVTQRGWSPDGLHRVAGDQGPYRRPGRRRSPAPTSLRLRLRGLGARQLLHVTLMEDDGTSWSAAVPVDSGWSEPVAAARRLRAGPRRAASGGVPRRVELLGGPGGGTRRQRRSPATRPRGAAAALAPARGWRHRHAGQLRGGGGVGEAGIRRHGRRPMMPDRWVRRIAGIAASVAVMGPVPGARRRPPCRPRSVRPRCRSQGADVSALERIEQAGGVFRDAGTPGDAIAILRGARQQSLPAAPLRESQRPGGAGQRPRLHHPHGHPGQGGRGQAAARPALLRHLGRSGPPGHAGRLGEPRLSTRWSSRSRPTPPMSSPSSSRRGRCRTSCRSATRLTAACCGR